jgi:TonB family protein
VALGKHLAIALAAWLALPGLARAQADAGAAADAVSDATPGESPETNPVAELIPPQPLRPATVPYPANAPPQDRPVVVRIKLSVGADGAVHKVELLSESLPVFDDAVVAAAKEFQFEPARYGGRPVPVEIAFTHTFQPPPPPPPPVEEGPPIVSALRGRLIELGTRAAGHGRHRGRPNRRSPLFSRRRSARVAFACPCPRAMPA